jgi:hypothetical protein
MGEGYIYSNREIGKQLEGGGFGYIPFKPLIPRQVLNFTCDNDYIIAYQIPSREWFDFETGNAITKEKKDSLEQLYNKMYDIHYCYWIIDKKKDQLYGPLDKKEFEKRCKKMGVKLKLNPKYENKYV